MVDSNTEEAVQEAPAWVYGTEEALIEPIEDEDSADEDSGDSED